MKRPYLVTLGLIMVVMALVLIFTSIKAGKKYKFNHKAEQMHAELLGSKHFLDPITAKELISKKDDNYLFVDIRNPGDFDNFHLEGAVNIPMQRVLDDAYISYLKNNKIKVLYSDESIDADQVRVLLTQYGYNNILVLQGGANYWKENMLSEDVFKAKKEYDDEKLKFDPDTIKSES